MIVLIIATNLLAIIAFAQGCRTYLKLKKLAGPQQRDRSGMSFPAVDLVFGKVETAVDARPLQRRVVKCFSTAFLLVYVSFSLIREV
jgi:hypothetical protein